MNVAREIRLQLGGHRFQIMTGAKDFVSSDHSLTFRLPGSLTRDRINLVKITLSPSDTYALKFYRVRGIESKLISEIDMIYADKLVEIFERYTGLATKL